MPEGLETVEEIGIFLGKRPGGGGSSFLFSMLLPFSFRHCFLWNRPLAFETSCVDLTPGPPNGPISRSATSCSTDIEGRDSS